MCFGECCADNLLRLMLMFSVQADVSCIWTNDSQRILLDNFDAIHNSPSHLYHSALLLSPSSSWLCACYSSELPQGVKVVRGLPAEWGACSRTVLLNSGLRTLSYWNNTIAVGSEDRDILILDAITGSQMAVLPGHTDAVRSLTFSSDGISLVSGSSDKTVKLWDVQTGGVIKTFHGHTGWVYSVSISADCTIIASGSNDRTLRLWGIEMGECCYIIKQHAQVSWTRFSPIDSQFLISIAGSATQCWDIDGHKVGSTFTSYCIDFSPDGTKFVAHSRDGITVQNINSGVTVAKFNTSGQFPGPCCFSPDGRLVAATVNHCIHIWDITRSDPHPVETFVGHTEEIISLTFSSPSTLISASWNKSVKFWQISALPKDTVVTNPKSTPLTLVPTKSITPEVKNSIIIPSGLDGTIKTWGISTGIHKGSLQIPAEDSHQSNIQPINSKLIFVWYADQKINIWDAEKGELLQTIEVLRDGVTDLKVSGDGSKVFCLYGKFIQAWDIWTRKAVGVMKFWTWGLAGILAIDDSKVWIEYKTLVSTDSRGWDFGIPGSSPVELSDNKQPPDRLSLNDTMVWEINMSRMKDVVTGKVVLQLPERFGRVTHVQWGGQYLVVSLRSKEVLVFDVSHMLL